MCIKNVVQIIKMTKKCKKGIGLYCVTCYNFKQQFSNYGEADE